VEAKLIFAWLLLAALPAALSRDLVSGVRSLPQIVPLIIISGVGLEVLSRRKALFGSFMVAMMFFMVYFLDLYFLHSPHFTGTDWLYPYRPAFETIKSEIGKYQNVVFTDKYGQPYIFALFYLKLDPKEYQSQNSFLASRDGDVGQVTKMFNFEFRPLFWPSDRGKKSTLFIGGQYELPEKDIAEMSEMSAARIIRQINNPNGTTGLKIVGLP
jgi:hypothetical protein